MMFDILIKGGRIVDGSGSKPFISDIGIKGDKIEAIGNLQSARHVIDAKGRVVTPGFIDVHSHSDRVLLVNPYAESKIRQGVTTEIIGNCGNSVFPLNNRSKKIVQQDFSKYNINIDWHDLLGYTRALEKRGVSINIAPLAGYRTVRLSAMGYASRTPSKKEMQLIKTLLHTSMKQGCYGVSTGLEYAGELSTTTEELIEISKVISSYGGVYASHIRGEGKNLIPSIKEAIKIGAKADISVQISHHKALGKRNWNKVAKTLSLIEEAIESGISVHADQYPYTACNTTILKKLPNWCLEEGKTSLLSNLKNASFRKKIVEGIINPKPDEEDSYLTCSWDKSQMVSFL